MARLAPRLAAAALVLVTIAGGTWWAAGGSDSEARDGVDGGVAAMPPDLDVVYASVTACTEIPGAPPGCSANLLAAEIAREQGRTLKVDPRADAALSGPFACGAWPTATALASLTEPEPVVILVEQRERDPRPEPAPGSTLHAHRRVLGDLVLYELSPYAEPRLLSWFGLPDPVEGPDG